ncbi:hypothetical protein [Kitasatospora sp. NPDC056531]|uniref:hypothetical protein n=1 Tax=Kitasatospora sp. NPDC056531 TaxID=3345856 RepID=UPI0036924ADB
MVQGRDPRLEERDQLNRLLAMLQRARAAAVAVALPTGALVPPAVRGAARQHGIPLLSISDDPASWLSLHHAIAEEHHARLMRTAELDRRLIEQTHHLGPPEGTQRLVTWLAAYTGAHVAVTRLTGPATAAAPASAEAVMAPARQTIAELACAGRGSAALDADGLQIRLFAIGNRRADDCTDSPVLAIAARAFTPGTTNTVGISVTSAMKYIHTAHPHRGGPIPR